VCLGGDFSFVGAGLGSGFANTAELHVMKYDETMATDEKEQWKKAVKGEHGQMQKHKVFKPVERSQVLKDAKILSSVWAMKKKASGIHCAQLNAHGYEQIDGKHCDENTKAAPVVNDATIKLCSS